MANLRLINAILLILLFLKISFSVTIEKDFGNGYKVIINYENEKFLNSSSQVRAKGNFKVVNASNHETIINDGSIEIVRITDGLSVSSSSLNISEKTFEVIFSSNALPGIYTAELNLTLNYSCNTNYCINSTLFNITLYVSQILLSIKIIPTVTTFFEENIIYANSTNYISISSKLYPKTLRDTRDINLKVTGQDACEDINNVTKNYFYLEYEPKNAGECILSVEATFEKDGIYFFNSTEIYLTILPYKKKVSLQPSFNVSTSQNYLNFSENENVTLKVFISVNIPQNFSVTTNISKENVEFEESIEIFGNKTLNFTFYNLRKGIYFVEINFTSNYSISKSLIITLNVSKFINLTFYKEEYEKIISLIKEKNLQNNETISKKIENLGEILKNLTVYKTEEYEEKFKKVSDEIKEIITKSEIKEKIIERQKKEEQKNMDSLPLIIVLSIVIVIVALIFFFFVRRRGSYFDFEKKKFIWRPEEEEVWKKLKEKWLKK